MKVLLFTSKEEDYLQDSIIHGFKKLYGENAVDYPVKSILYNDYQNLSNIRGGGFTLYGLLDKNLKSNSDRPIEKDIANDEFHLIVFTSIHRQYKIFYKYFELLKRTNAVTWILDGEDTPVLFPYMGKQLKKFLFSPKPHNNFFYFKRELYSETLDSIYFRLPVSLTNKILLPEKIKMVSFSIPAEKIISGQPVKSKLFTQQIVDEEVNANVYGGNRAPLFENEDDYYNDIQVSKFGITTKRAGWDCLRHYEIAANSAVICFKNLNDKPASCAPHGLIDNENCISYSQYEDLINRINSMSDNEYLHLQNGLLKWVKNYSTEAQVKKMIDDYYT